MTGESGGVVFDAEGAPEGRETRRVTPFGEEVSVERTGPRAGDGADDAHGRHA